MEYTLHMRDEGGATEDATIEADDLAGARRQIEAECEAWAEGGEWGVDGARVWVGWTLDDADGDEVDDGSHTVVIEPSHDDLIASAIRGEEDRSCGASPDVHSWSSEGEGGCRENPGVWSTGGTSMRFRSTCRRCGLSRTESVTGMQRNPGDHDTVEYRLPDLDEIEDMIRDGSMDGHAGDGETRDWLPEPADADDDD